MGTFRKLVVPATLAIAGNGCWGGGPTVSEEPMSKRGEAIVHGESTPPPVLPGAGDAWYTGALAVRVQKPGAAPEMMTCTATMLSCGVAVTSARCASASDAVLTPLGINTRAAADDAFSDPEHGYRVVAVKVHPGYVPAPVGQNSTDEANSKGIALLKLEYSGSGLSEVERTQQKLERAALTYPSITAGQDLGEPLCVGLSSPPPGTGWNVPAYFVGYGQVEAESDGQCVHVDQEVIPGSNPTAYYHLRTYGRLGQGVEIWPEWPTTLSKADCPPMNSADQWATPGDLGAPFTDSSDYIFGILSATDGEPGKCNCSQMSFANICHVEMVPWILETEREFDSDRDGIPDACDICLDSGPDSDSDGLQDSCDPCPYDPDPVEVADPDGDGICNINAPDGSGDNCPNVANPVQKNTNLLVEIANDAAQVGDECEPVPQPVFEPQRQLEQSNYECHSANRTTGIEYTVCWSRYALASDGPNLTFNPRGSFKLVPQPPITTEASGGEEHQVSVSQTDFRYCVHNPDYANCFAPTAINEVYLHNELLGADYEDASSLFHRVRVDAGSVDVSAMGAATYATSQPEKDIAWDWVSDFDRWRTTPWGAGWVPNPEPGLDVNSLDRGQFWMHAVTDVGMKNAPLLWKLLTGVHPSNGDPNGAEHLANHYEAVFPSEDHPTWDAHKILYKEPETFWQRPCINCGEIDPQDLLDLFGDPIDERSWFNQFESRLITKLGDDVGVVIPDGRAVLLSEERVSTAVRQFLGGSDVVVPYCEANPRLRNGQQAADFLVVAKDGSRIVTSIIARGMRVVTPVRSEVMLASTEAQSEPSPRTDFVPVYSRSTARLFVIGGTDNATGEQTGEIWRRASTGSDGWNRLPLTDYTPGKVLAATYSYRDNHLWILDEVTLGRHLSKARLTRVHAGTGVAEVLGTWPRLKLFESHWMMLDRDGSVLLFASSSRTRAHWVFKLDPDGGALVGMRRRNGMLVVRPSVDMEGYSFLSQNKASQPPTVVRRTELHLVPAGWLGIGQCL